MDSDICLICTDPIIDLSDIENNTPYVKCEQCNNKFHDVCISKLFYYNKKNNIQTTCPTCRHVFSDMFESSHEDEEATDNNDPLLYNHMNRIVQSQESSHWKKHCLCNFIGTFIVIGGIVFLSIIDDDSN